MPSDKPIFFKPEDFLIGTEMLLDDGFLEQQMEHFEWIAGQANKKAQPLLQAMEIMREALDDIVWHGPQDIQGLIAEKALKKCDEIFKDFSSLENQP